MRRGIGLIIIICLMLSGCWKAADEPAPVVRPLPQSGSPQAATEADVPDAVLLAEGAESPDGRYHLWLMKGEASKQADNLIVWDSEENLIKWWDDIRSIELPSVVWSHDGSYLAVARESQTEKRITVIETAHWSDYDICLPDGTSLAKNTVIPEDWGTWTETNVFRFQLGPEEARTAYRCSVEITEQRLTGTVDYAAETLLDGLDMNQNGIPERITLEGNAGEDSTFWVVRLLENDTEIWADSAAVSHAGWNSLFVCRIEGDSYLFRYLPTMYQGFADYRYELFLLDENGEEQILIGNEVQFDEVFDSGDHQSFDIEKIADFLWEVRGYLSDSVLLLSTEDGIFQSEISGLELQYYPFGRTYEDMMRMESRDDMLAALRLYDYKEQINQGS